MSPGIRNRLSMPDSIGAMVATPPVASETGFSADQTVWPFLLSELSSRSSTTSSATRYDVRLHWGSESTKSTRLPVAAKAAARFIVRVVFPTPPLWLNMLIRIALVRLGSSVCNSPHPFSVFVEVLFRFERRRGRTLLIAAFAASRSGKARTNCSPIALSCLALLVEGTR